MNIPVLCNRAYLENQDSNNASYDEKIDNYFFVLPVIYIYVIIGSILFVGG